MSTAREMAQNSGRSAAPNTSPATPSPLVFVDRRSGGGDLLRAMTDRAGFELRWGIPLSEWRFRQEVQRAAKDGRIVVHVNYPIQSAQDTETIEQFVRHGEIEGGGWYYAPRPNDYFAVSDASLISMTPRHVLSGADGAGQNLRSALYWTKLLYRRLPHSLRQQLRPIILPIYFRVMNRTDNTTQSDEPLREIVPDALKDWPGEWNAWKPPIGVRRRDLLDRVESYFPHPRGIHVILLNKCNLSCVMCPYHSPKYEHIDAQDYFNSYRSMSFEIFKRIADYAARNNISLQFGQIEEVFMHKRALDFIEYGRDVGVPHMHLTTNGTLLDEDKARRLAKSGIDSVMFSIDAVNAETYREIRGDDLEKLERNIRTFIPLAKREGIGLAASFILQPQALEERDSFLQKWRDIGVNRVTFYVLSEHDAKTGDMIRSEEMYDKGERYACASPWIQSVVFPEGQVSLCCKTMTDVRWRGVVSVGDLSKDTFEDIWRGDRYREVRRELIDNHFRSFDVCKKCQIWSASTAKVEYIDGAVRQYNETMETYTFR